MDPPATSAANAALRDSANVLGAILGWLTLAAEPGTHAACCLSGERSSIFGGGGSVAWVGGFAAGARVAASVAGAAVDSEAGAMDVRWRCCGAPLPLGESCWECRFAPDSVAGVVEGCEAWLVVGEGVIAGPGGLVG